jgi:hypothetical protein
MAISRTDIDMQVEEMEQNVKDMDDVEINIIPFGSNEVVSDDIQENKSIQTFDVASSVHISKYTVDNASLLGCYGPSTFKMLPIL